MWIKLGQGSFRWDRRKNSSPRGWSGTEQVPCAWLVLRLSSRQEHGAAAGLQVQLLTAVLFQSIEQLEKEMLNGQKLQGPQTSAELHRILKSKNAVEK